jgi:pimeloyl-ACP methyl ester carboxylesterase
MTLVTRTFSTPRHTTRYLECGPADGPLMMFLHGWPSISLMWHAQLNAFAAEGWHCVAPDLRGFGGSSAPAAIDAYTTAEVVTDMAELHDHLGGAPAIWVGHDWGSVVAGALAAHEATRSRGVVLTSLAYFPGANALPTLVPLVDRAIHPIAEYPDGQWDYYRYYTTHFDAAVADLDADRAATLASIFQPGRPAAVGAVSPNALVTRNGGRFGAAHRAPATPPDPALWPPADFDALVQAFDAHGFRPPCAWYLNDDANIAYARAAPNGGRLAQPVLFVNGDWDGICSIIGNRQGDPMRAACSDLTVTSLPAGHWLPLERKAELTRAIGDWLRDNELAGGI